MKERGGKDGGGDSGGPGDLALTVCLFAWNEAMTLAEVADEIVGVARTMGIAFEVVVIDDGSTDGTSEVADAVAARTPEVRVIHHGDNRGLGGVYRTGFAEARGKNLSFFPADGQFPATILADFYPRMATCDAVLGYLPSRTDLVGKTLSTVERILYRALVGPMPRFQGVFMMRTDVIRSLPLASRGRGWGIVMELIVRAYRTGHRLESIPTALRPRKVGESKVNNLANIRANLRQLAVMRRTLAESVASAER